MFCFIGQIVVFCRSIFSKSCFLQIQFEDNPVFCKSYLFGSVFSRFLFCVYVWQVCFFASMCGKSCFCKSIFSKSQFLEAYILQVLFYCSASLMIKISFWLPFGCIWLSQFDNWNVFFNRQVSSITRIGLYWGARRHSMAASFMFTPSLGYHLCLPLQGSQVIWKGNVQSGVQAM